MDRHFSRPRAPSASFSNQSLHKLLFVNQRYYRKSIEPSQLTLPKAALHGFTSTPLQGRAREERTPPHCSLPPEPSSARRTKRGSRNIHMVVVDPEASKGRVESRLRHQGETANGARSNGGGRVHVMSPPNAPALFRIAPNSAELLRALAGPSQGVSRTILGISTTEGPTTVCVSNIYEGHPCGWGQDSLDHEHRHS